ncbi:hypothetical protein [Thalassoroseus pseudoceratinae]|uniref:hypothetical protein n=1 Tax=Thalassoroseus pseudoceratinae TaxID=2713176 RepID=UPI0014247EC2|nr:hypothetical protein [Thalassoroseus pseudoceratinae]
MSIRSRGIVFVTCVALTVLAPTPGRSQGDVSELQQQIRKLETQLRSAQQKELGKRRFTTIGSGRTDGKGRGISIRVYDLSDLFTIAPAYPAQYEDAISTNGGFGQMFSAGGTPTGSGGGGFGGAGFFNVQSTRGLASKSSVKTSQQFGAVTGDPSSMQTTMDHLTAAIQQTISPELWDEDGVITQLGSNLLISADDHTHQQISDLLNLFRKRWGTLRTVSVQAWWVWLDEGELTELLADPNQPIGPEDRQAFGLIEPDNWRKYLVDHAAAKNEKNAESQPGWHAVITCYNGQTVHTLAGGQHRFLTNMMPVMGQEVMGYQPQMNLLQTGAALQLTPVTNTTGQTVLLDVRSRVCLLNESKVMEKVEQIAGENNEPAQLKAVVDRPRVDLQKIATTVRVPVDTPMLIGGMTFADRPQTGEKNLYLFVQAHVQELRNDEEDVLPDEAVEEVGTAK